MTDMTNIWFDGFEKRQFNVNGVVVCARLSANWLSQLDKPVLVRVRTTPVNRAEFARQTLGAFG